jgi:hypothetical protein
MRKILTVGLICLVTGLYSQTTSSVDRDEDGFISKFYGGDDYNDLDESIHPGIPVVGFNLDLNHNGIIEEHESMDFEDQNRNALVDVHDLLILLYSDQTPSHFEHTHLIDQLVAYYNTSCLGF